MLSPLRDCKSNDLGLSQPQISAVINQTLIARTAPQIIHKVICSSSTHGEVLEKQVVFMQIVVLFFKFHNSLID